MELNEVEARDGYFKTEKFGNCCFLQKAFLAIRNLHEYILKRDMM